jgi:hypothetical protein
VSECVRKSCGQVYAYLHLYVKFHIHGESTIKTCKVVLGGERSKGCKSDTGNRQIN